MRVTLGHTDLFVRWDRIGAVVPIAPYLAFGPEDVAEQYCAFKKSQD